MNVIYILYFSGLILTLYIAFRAYIGISSTSWPTTSGEIKKVDIYAQKRNDKYLYHPRVSYQYEINSKTFKSRALDSRIVGSPDKNEIQNEISVYKVGENVTVHYHPFFNSISFLKTGLQQDTVYLILAIPGIMILITAIGHLITGNQYWVRESMLWVIHHVI